MAVASVGPSHFAVHWEHPPDVPFIVHDLPFSGANAVCVNHLLAVWLSKYI